VDPADLRQESAASDQAQQAVLGSGTLNAYFGDRHAAAEPEISIAPPLGQRDENLPLRGRDELLAVLAAARACVQVVHGLGGCGKTRLALEAAYLAEQRGIEVWWVSAVNLVGLVTGMRALGRRLGATDAELQHGDAADLIWRRLTGRQEPWLLVVDNADDPQLLAGAGDSVADGRGWVRPVSSPSGAVLITSRDGSTTSWGPWCQRSRLLELPADTAAGVLADHTGQRTDLGTDEEARALAERLGGLPLALKIAGSYLAESARVPAAFADKDAIRGYRKYREAIENANLSESVIGRTWDMT
jgi:hypothetical protein